MHKCLNNTQKCSRMARSFFFKAWINQHPEAGGHSTVMGYVAVLFQLMIICVCNDEPEHHINCIHENIVDIYWQDWIRREEGGTCAP